MLYKIDPPSRSDLDIVHEKILEHDLPKGGNACSSSPVELLSCAYSHQIRTEGWIKCAAMVSYRQLNAGMCGM
jgi:hypothetical protein